MSQPKSDFTEQESHECDRLRDASAVEKTQVEGGRNVNDGCYLFYGYYCPCCSELKGWGE